MLNVETSAGGDAKSLQQFRFYRSGGNTRCRAGVVNDISACQRQSGSRVKTVGSGRRIVARSLNMLQTERVITRRSSRLEESGRTFLQLEPLSPAPIADISVLPTVSLSHHAVYNWLCNGRHATPEAKLHAPQQSECSDDSLTKCYHDLKKSIYTLQNNICACGKSSCCDLCKMSKVKASPLSCSSSNTSLTPSSCSNNSKHVGAKIHRSLSSADCTKLRSWRRTRSLMMPESPVLSDIDLKERSVNECTESSSLSSEKLTAACERPKRVVSLKKAVNILFFVDGVLNKSFLTF